jgi:uncharacterized protein (DUF1778 family)
MSKTVTLRLDDSSYAMFKTAAQAEKRTLSNFIEYAALQFLGDETYVSEEEMHAILDDSALLARLKQARRDVKQRKYQIVP